MSRRPAANPHKKLYAFHIDHWLKGTLERSRIAIHAENEKEAVKRVIFEAGLEAFDVHKIYLHAVLPG